MREAEAGGSLSYVMKFCVKKKGGQDNMGGGNEEEMAQRVKLLGKPNLS